MRLSTLAILLLPVVLLAGATAANKAKPKPEPTAEQPQHRPPEGIIGDSRAAIAEARAIMQAFREGGLSITLAKPPTNKPAAAAVPTPAACPTCPTYPPRPTPTGRVVVPQQSSGACAGGSCGVRRPILYRLSRGRRGG